MSKKYKATLVVPATKPRNPLVAAAHTRHAGEHRKTRKAVRQADRLCMHRNLDALLNEELTEFDIG